LVPKKGRAEGNITCTKKPRKQKKLGGRWLYEEGPSGVMAEIERNNNTYGRRKKREATWTKGRAAKQSSLTPKKAGQSYY